MLRILVIIAFPLAACAPAPQKDAMPNSIEIPDGASPGSSEPSPPENISDNSGSSARVARDAPKQLPIPSPLSVAASTQPANNKPADTSAEAVGRKIVSTAFVRLGPGEYLTVELRNGQTVVLRDVTMRPGDFCGVQIAGGQGKAKFCGQYGEVVAARPGGGAAHGDSPTDPAGVPIDPGKSRP